MKSIACYAWGEARDIERVPMFEGRDVILLFEPFYYWLGVDWEMHGAWFKKRPTFKLKKLPRGVTLRDFTKAGYSLERCGR